MGSKSNFVRRDKTLTMYPRPLRPGERKHAPNQSDCATRDASGFIAEPGADGGEELEKLDKGTNATIRVVFMKVGAIASYKGHPIREGEIAHIFPADLPHEDMDNTSLAISVVSFEKPFRAPEYIEFKLGDADHGDVFQDEEMVEFGGAMLSTYACEVPGFITSASGIEKCRKYDRMKDVFQFRMLRTASVQADPLGATEHHNTIVSRAFGHTSTELCEGAVKGSVRRHGPIPPWVRKVCKCPDSLAISGSPACREASEALASNNGRKFDPDDFQGKNCECRMN
jgi:hypothetical protein